LIYHLIDEGLALHATRNGLFWQHYCIFVGLMARPYCLSTERRWLVIQIALNLTRLSSPCYNNTTLCSHVAQDNGNRSNTNKPKHSE